MYGNSNDGGATANTAPSDNIVNIGTGGHVTDNVYGAFTNDASANVAGNTVTINGNGSTASDPVNNSGDYFSVYGGVNNDTNASSSTVVSGNRVVIDTSGTVDSYVWGGFGQGSAQVTDNHVTVTNTNSGTITGALVGGRGNSGEVSGNSVTLQGTGNVGTGPGGEKSIRGGYATGSGGNAIGNAVYIGKDANGVGDYTGTIYSGAIWGGGVSLGDANGNTINISGGTFINTQIHAGYLGSTSSGTAINNIVTIEGTPSFSGVGLYGGFQANNSSFASDLISGNTLNLKTSVNIKNLKNFQYLNFYLPTTLANGGAMLTIESGGTADITDSIVNVGIDGRASPLAVGNTVKLIDASVGTLTGAPVNNTANGTGMQGVTLRYAFDIQATNKQLLAKVTSIRADETSKALVEGFLSGTAFLNQGADFVVHEGLSAALAARRAETRFNGFAAISGGSLTHDTGSHIDVDGYTLIAGLAAHFGENLTAGAFVEHGEGDYDTYNSFSTGRVRGKGDADYTGLGLMAQWKLTEAFSLEGSLRSGKVKTDFGSNDLGNAGQHAAYDAKSTYVSAHLGAGYRFKLNAQSSLKLYGQYLWSHQNGDSVRLTTGDPVKFNAVNSHRTRLGVKWDYALNSAATTYLGAAWEHEFDGKAKATTYGYRIDAPDLKGDTGMVEAGLTLSPSANKPLTVDLGLRGYAGQREGVTGGVRVNYAF